MNRTGPSNYQLKNLIEVVKAKALKEKSLFWKRMAEDLEKPSRQRKMVNVYKINKYAQDGEIIVVPGKVLGTGELHKKVEVAAFSFSIEAEKKINQKGKAITLNELLKNNVKPSKVRILG